MFSTSWSNGCGQQPGRASRAPVCCTAKFGSSRRSPPPAMSQWPQKATNTRIDKAIQKYGKCGDCSAKPIRRCHHHHETGRPREEQQSKGEGVDEGSSNKPQEQENRGDADADCGPSQKMPNHLTAGGQGHRHNKRSVRRPWSAMRRAVCRTPRLSGGLRPPAPADS